MSTKARARDVGSQTCISCGKRSCKSPHVTLSSHCFFNTRALYAKTNILQYTLRLNTLQLSPRQVPTYTGVGSFNPSSVKNESIRFKKGSNFDDIVVIASYAASPPKDATNVDVDGGNDSTTENAVLLIHP